MRKAFAHELALGAFAIAAGLAVLISGAVGLGLALLGGLAAFVALARVVPEKVRLALAYVLALGLYQSIRFVAPALGRAPIDAQLSAIWPLPELFTPRPALTELFSAAYLSYQLYLHGALAHALFRPLDEARHLYRGVFTAMAIGFAGYVLFPATGPTHAVLEGGPITAINAWVVREGSSVYDAFPSLHVAITAMVLAHDARFARRRFVAMLPVFGLLVISTLYLRYHHPIDLVAGAALAAAVIAGQLPRSKPA